MYFLTYTTGCEITVVNLPT